MWCDPWGDHVQGLELGFHDLNGFFPVIFYEMRRDTAQASLLTDALAFCFSWSPSLTVISICFQMLSAKVSLH